VDLDTGRAGHERRSQIAITKGDIVQFSVGDKVVHPHHGPGQITGVEQKEFLDGKKLYYKIEIPEHGLTVYLPSKKLQEIGVRLAMSRARLPRVLDRLRKKPGRLPDDYKERQEVVWEKLKTGRVSQMAEVVRDLTWHKHRDHLTKKDAELLAQGTQRLAAEMALATGAEVSEMEKAIVDTLAAVTSDQVDQERRHQRAAEVTGLHHVWEGRP